MNDLDRDTVSRFGLEGPIYSFQITSTFKAIPWQFKLESTRIINLDTGKWYKNAMVDIHNPRTRGPNEEELIRFNKFDVQTVESLQKDLRKIQQEQKANQYE